MKAILISIQSPHACNILNLLKLWEIRKKFPKDYVGWVYIYCTKAQGLGQSIGTGKWLTLKERTNWNGKVVARFWCDKVDEFYNLDNIMLAQTCLSKEELADYLQGNKGYAIHITNLEIFDKPKEISEFSRVVLEPRFFNGGEYYEEDKRFLTRAPESWCYIEI